MNYQTNATDPHVRDEETQWARIAARGDAARGMALVLMQKLCTAFHEYEPAFRAGAIDAAKIDLFRTRLAARVRAVVESMRLNGLGDLDGCADLSDFANIVEAAPTAEALADLTETVHRFGHRICDALERE